MGVPYALTAVPVDDPHEALHGVAHIHAEDGVAIVSRRIEFELNKILEIADFETLSFGIAYEEERQYWFFTPGSSTDTFPTVAWVYNFVSQKQPWVQRLKPVSHGVVLREGDRMFLAHAQDTFVLQERKSFETNERDFLDETLDITIDAVGLTVDEDGVIVSLIDITYTYPNVALDEGFLIEQAENWLSLLRQARQPVFSLLYPLLERVFRRITGPRLTDSSTPSLSSPTAYRVRITLTSVQSETESSES